MKAGQILAGANQESPPHSSIFKHSNWTITYRHDADFTKSEKFVLYDEGINQVRREGKNYASGKTKTAAWFVSNCHESGPWKVTSGRKAYAKELAKYIDVDIFCRCGSLICPRISEKKCFEMLQKNYKFYRSGLREFHMSRLHHEVLFKCPKVRKSGYRCGGGEHNLPKVKRI